LFSSFCFFARPVNFSRQPLRTTFPPPFLSPPVVLEYFSLSRVEQHVPRTCPQLFKMKFCSAFTPPSLGFERFLSEKDESNAIYRTLVEFLFSFCDSFSFVRASFPSCSTRPQPLSLFLIPPSEQSKEFSLCYVTSVTPAPPFFF